jgi:hypothetical protein
MRRWLFSWLVYRHKWPWVNPRISIDWTTILMWTPTYLNEFLELAVKNNGYEHSKYTLKLGLLF